MNETLESAHSNHLDGQAERPPCNPRKVPKTKFDMLEQAIEEE